MGEIIVVNHASVPSNCITLLRNENRNANYLYTIINSITFLIVDPLSFLLFFIYRQRCIYKEYWCICISFFTVTEMLLH